MKRRISKRIIAIGISLCVAFSIMPLPVSAEAENAAPAVKQNNLWVSTGKTFVNRIYTVGLTTCGSALVRIAGATESEGFQKVASFVNKWICGGNNTGQTLAEIQALCNEILNEVKIVDQHLKEYDAEIENTLQKIQYTEAKNELNQQFVNDNGVITGYITDGVGFVKNLEINGVSVKDKKIVVLGAGGAATAIQVQLALDGAKEVNIFNIKDKFYERAEGTKAKLAEKCPDCVVTVEDLADKAKLEEEIKTCDILINTTIMGMKPHEDVTLVDKSLFRKDLVVADTVYNPEKTKMILEAEEAGCKAIGGAGMLLQQGAVNYELFVGKEMPLAEYQEFQKAQAK